jgi:GxxExxY protein
MLVKIPFTNITREIIAAAIEVHRVLGPGLLESAYSSCLRHELSARKLPFTSERGIPLVYKGINLDCAYRLDLLVKEVIVVEVKTVAAVLPIHQAQLLTYLRLADVPVGLVVNFEVERLVDGVKRVINPRWSGAKAGRSIAAAGGLP